MVVSAETNPEMSSVVGVLTIVIGAYVLKFEDFRRGDLFLPIIRDNHLADPNRGHSATAQGDHNEDHGFRFHQSSLSHQGYWFGRKFG